MLEIKSYNNEQLAEALGISVNTLNSKRRVTEERHLSKYNWSKEGKGKKTIYKIEGLNENEASPLIDTFYSLLEDFSGQDVYFKNPETAIKVLYFLYQRNENIALFISRDLGISKSTVRDYIKRFRKLGLLVGYWDSFNIDGKEVEGQVLSQIQYDYYQVIDGIWYENNLNGWKAAWDFKRNAYEHLVEEIEQEKGWFISEDEEKVVKILANKLLVEEHGEQKRVEHKYLNEDAKLFLGSYLVYAAKKLGLSLEKKEQKSIEYIKSLYQKPVLPKNSGEELLLANSFEVVDVCRKYVGDFEEWLMQQKEKQMEQEPIQLGFLTNEVKAENKINEEQKVMSFKQFVLNHEFMKVQKVPKAIEEEVEEIHLQLEEDPFTGEQQVFNIKTQKWEKYIEAAWVNGEKVDPISATISEFPSFKYRGKSSALDELLGSVI